MKKALLMLLLAAPASAEFTDAEKAEIVELEKAQEQYASSLSRAFKYVRTNPAAASAVQNYANTVIDMRYFAFRALLRYMDWGADTMSRATVIASGQSLLQATKSRMAQGNNKLSAIEALCSTCSDVTAARASFDSANTFVNGFDTSLAYANPIVPENEDPQAPGAQRGLTPVIHPHGLHSAVMGNADGYSTHKRTSEKRLGDALLDNPAVANIEAYWGGHILDEAQLVGRALILLVGAEHDNDVAQIDQMEGGGVTVRPRHFFRILLAMEKLINVAHGGPADVTGRQLTRGFPYAVNQMCIETGRWLRDNSVEAHVQDLGRFLDSECGAWTSTDNMASQMLILRAFTVIGPPPVDCGGGTCPDGSTFCDPLTTSWDGVKCVSSVPPSVCEFFASVTAIDNQTVEVKCVEVP